MMTVLESYWVQIKGMHSANDCGMNKDFHLALVSSLKGQSATNGSTGTGLAHSMEMSVLKSPQ